MEPGNGLFDMFPKMRVLKGMIQIGVYVGLAQRCKQFCQKFYVKQDGNKDQCIAKWGKSAKQTPKRRATFKLFTLLFDKKISLRKLKVKTVYVMTGKVFINVKNQKLEDCMMDVDKCGSTCLFNGVTHFWSEEITQMKESAANKGRGFEDENDNVNHEMNLIVLRTK